MIISDKYSFAFIHIPKCAGTTIKKTLLPYDDLSGAHTDRVDTHSVLGKLDYVHIPLFILKDYFSIEYEKINKYKSFAVMRDPFSRFPSSVSQYVRMYTDKDIKAISKKDLTICTDKIMDILMSNKPGELLRFEFIHFQRQCDFIFFRGNRIIKNLYPIDSIDKMFIRLNEIIGQDVLAIYKSEPRKENYTEIFRSKFFRLIVNGIKPILNRPAMALFSKSFREGVHGFLYGPRDMLMKDVFNSYSVRSFIENYYKEDIEVFNSLRK